MTRYAPTRSLIRSNAEFPNGLTVSLVEVSANINTGQMLGNYVTRSGYGTIPIDLNYSNSLTSTDSVGYLYLAANVQASTGSFPEANWKPAYGSTYGTKKVGLGFSVGTSNQAFRANTGAADQGYMNNVNGVIFGYMGSGPRIIASDYDFEDDTPNTIRLIADETYFPVGNVGIGTTSPGAKLDVAGTLRLNGTTAGTNYTEIKSAATPSTNVTYTLPSSAPASTGYYLTSTTGGAMSWGTPVVAPTITIGTTGTDFNGSSQSGPDTIFLNLPTASSSVRGALSSTDWTTFNGKTTLAAVVAATNSWAETQTFANATYSALFTGGNVGIGTTGPGSKLDVKGTLRLSGSTSGYVGFSVPADAGSTTYLLPAADGTNGQVLSTNSTGTLSWVTASGGGGGASLSTANTWTENQNFDKSSVFSSIYFTTITTYGSTGWNPNYGSSPIYTTSANAGSGSSWTGTLTASGGATVTFLVGDNITATHTATSGGAVTTVTLVVATAVSAASSVNFTIKSSLAAGTLEYSSIVVKRFVYQNRGKISATRVTGDYGAILNGLSFSASESDGTFSSDYGTSATVAGGGLFILGFNEGTTMTGSSVGSGTIRATNTTGTNNSGGSLTISGGNGTGTGASGQLIFKTGKAVASGTSNHTPTYRMIIDSGGNVGIGDYSNNGYTTRGMPGATLEIFGQMRIKGTTAGYLGFAAADSSSSTTYTFPSADGTIGQVLSTNGSATLGWASTGSSITQVTFAESTAAPNDTVYVDSIKAAGTPAGGNVDLALSPKGTGALTAQVADSTATGGNKRGANAVDWQSSVRVAATQVASGAQATISGGKENTASGIQSVVGGGLNNAASAIYTTIGGGYAGTASAGRATIAGGYLNTASGGHAIISGGYANTASGSYATVPGGFNGNAELEGKFAYACGNFGFVGDAQFGLTVCRATTTTNAAVNLTNSGNGTFSATNHLVLPNNRVYRFTIDLVASSGTIGTGSTTTYGSFGGVWTITGAIRRAATAATTSIIGAPIVLATAVDAELAAVSFTVLAEASSYGSLQIVATGLASTQIHWVATIMATEVG